jgi:hypothetical protein
LEAAERLAEVSGHHLGKAAWSAMERSVEGTRTVNFGADLVEHLAATFDVAIADLFDEIPEPVSCPRCGGTGEIDRSELSSDEAARGLGGGA